MNSLFTRPHLIWRSLAQFMIIVCAINFVADIAVAKTPNKAKLIDHSDGQGSNLANIDKYVSNELDRTHVDPIIIEDILVGEREYPAPPVRRAFEASPMTSPRPSLQNLICWRQSLNDVADKIHATIVSQMRKNSPRGNHTAELIPSTPADPAQSARRVLEYRLRTKLAGLDAGDGHQLPCMSGNPGPELQPPFMWRVPILIASTGDPEIDRLIARAVIRIRKQVPRAPLNDASFPAPLAVANIFLSGNRPSFRPYELVRSCIARRTCTTLEEIVQGDRRKASLSATVAWLGRSYPTLPYEDVFEEDAALVETSPDGGIVAAACGSDPPYPLAELAELRIVSCLLQAMGAYPAGHHDISDDNSLGAARQKYEDIIDVEIRQLQTLYR